MQKSGSVLVAAQLAKELGILDTDGKPPIALDTA
jgi:hypothetical protein